MESVDGHGDSCPTASWQMRWLLKPFNSLGPDLAGPDRTPRNSLYPKAYSRSWDDPPVSSPKLPWLPKSKGPHNLLESLPATAQPKFSLGERLQITHRL